MSERLNGTRVAMFNVPTLERVGPKKITLRLLLPNEVLVWLTSTSGIHTSGEIVSVEIPRRDSPYTQRHQTIIDFVVTCIHRERWEASEDSMSRLCLTQYCSEDDIYRLRQADLNTATTLYKAGRSAIHGGSNFRDARSNMLALRSAIKNERQAIQLAGKCMKLVAHNASAPHLEFGYILTFTNTGNIKSWSHLYKLRLYQALEVIWQNELYLRRIHRELARLRHKAYISADKEEYVDIANNAQKTIALLERVIPVEPYKTMVEQMLEGGEMRLLDNLHLNVAWGHFATFKKTLDKSVDILADVALVDTPDGKES